MFCLETTLAVTFVQTDWQKHMHMHPAFLYYQYYNAVSDTMLSDGRRGASCLHKLTNNQFHWITSGHLPI